MKIYYLDHNIYIYALSDTAIIDAIELCKKNKVQFAYSPAHIEEIYKALIDNNVQPYIQTAQKLLNLISRTTNSLELLPSGTGIVMRREPPSNCFHRVHKFDTTERIASDSKQIFQTDRASYHSLQSEDKHFRDISNVPPDKIWEHPNFKKTIDEINQAMPYIVQKQNHSFDTFYCGLQGADKKLPTDLRIEPNSFQVLRASHTQLEFIIEKLFRVLSVHGYNADTSAESAISGIHDITHAIYATETDKFFTTDERFAQRCRAVYFFLGIPTQVVSCKPNQIVTTLQNSI